MTDPTDRYYRHFHRTDPWRDIPYMEEPLPSKIIAAVSLLACLAVVLLVA